MIYSYKQNNHNYIFYLNRDTTKHHKYWILLYLKQNIPKKIEEILLNLNQLHRRWGRTTGLLFNIFVKFISLTSINIVLQTVAGNYKKYNFFLIFSAEYDIIFLKIRKIAMNHLDWNRELPHSNKTLQNRKENLSDKAAGNCTNLWHKLVEVFSTPCLKVKTF